MQLNDFLTERSLSKKEKGKKEKYVKGMKGAKSDFVDRYGKDAKAVMYATATKMAKESLEEKKMVTFQTSVGGFPGYDDHTPLNFSDYEAWELKTDKSNPKKNIISQRYQLYLNAFQQYVDESAKDSLKALARHVKEGVPLPDSLFRYQSEAYFDTFIKAKQLREMGSLPELDWESEEMLSTDIGESFELENGETVWLDVPYLDESEMPDLNDEMIGVPDNYYDEEERRDAFVDLQDALTGGWEDQYVIDGVCPNCAGTGYQDAEDEIWDEEEGEYVEGNECDGYGQYGCDEGEMQGAIWKEIMAFDQQNVDRQKAKDEYPGDEEVIKGLANMMKNMDDPRQAYQQMQVDYPQMGRAQRSNLIAKAKQMAFPESVEIDEIRKLAGLNELRDRDEDIRSDIEKIEDLLKDAIGPESRGQDMYELYAELESMNPDIADEIKLIAKELYGVRLEEGKSPHKKGTKKYKKHMAAMHAEARGRKLQYQGIADTVVGPNGKEFVFDKDKNMFISTDSGEPGGPEKVARNTPLGKKLFNKRKYKMSRLDSDINEAEYQGKKVELNKPKRGGSKKYYVYVKTPKGNVKKISFGDVTGLKAKAGNKKAAKSFAARHNCEKKNDKQKAGYWACRLPRYGLVKGGKWW